ncbi:hypothetical protein Ahy_A01g002183 isoform B [Arachis hypogaea]|uniref:NADH:quinone oxidoreductase/Mrp antiporter transmembrane domain-containing protein n=1 Tax=Arachis hypogaea TaxID=3818 RepID=A0A445EQ93_ARAHY|nr:hypothetical protein Ahy_A01g002183 isoform B [Arachis hypogaea]
MGAYGLVRINMELLPHAHSIFSPWLMLLGSIQIIYAASTSLGQRNLKKRIAYFSVSHMGFIIIGIGSISDTGLRFFSWREHVMIDYVFFILTKGGMAIPMPKIFTVFSILSMVSLALPGMSGFVAELMIFFEY